MNPIPRSAKKPALIIVGGLLALLAFTWLALPGILQTQAEKFIAERTGHRLTLARPEINPLELSLRLREVRLVDAQQNPLFGFHELFVDLSAASINARTLVFDTIQLDGLDASLVQRQDGSLNWGAFIAALKNPEPQPDKGLPRIDIRHLRLAGARLAVTDERLTPAFVTRVEPLELELTDVSTLPDDAGKFKLQAKTTFGANLTWQGDVTLNPLASSGRLDIGNVNLERLAPLLQDRLPLAPPAGIATLGGDYRLQQAGDSLRLEFEHLRLSIAALGLQQAAGDTAPRLAVDRLEVKDGSFDLASRKLALAGIQLHGNRVEGTLDQKQRTPVLQLDQVAVGEIKVDLAHRQASIATLAVTGGSIGARRDAQGRIDLLGLIDSLGAKPDRAAPAAAEPAVPWHFKIGQVSFADFSVALRDESVTPAAVLGLDHITASVDGVSENLTAPLPFKASLDVHGGGRLELDGILTLADAAADLKVRLSGLPLKAAQPYVSKFAALDVADGSLAAAGRLYHGTKGSGYRGSLGVNTVRLNETGTQKVFLAWKALASDDIDLTPNRLNIAQLRLDGLDTKLIIAKDKSTNLQRILHRDAAAATSPAPAATPAFAVNIDQLRLRNGAMDFADDSLLLPFATRIHGLRGALAGLSTQPGAPGQVELDGEVDEFGLARAVGQVDFMRPTEFMDINVIFRNVEMQHMTPYSATFAGRKIAAGKMSLNLDYKIKQRQLTGENQIVIDQLELGERVESPSAKDLPLDLALALLRDADGRIDLGMPIAGSLDDPQFSYGQIIWKAISNILTKVVTAPFRALGALFGGGGEKVDNVAFDAGAARLTPPEREKLLRLATALNQRPGLALSMRGTWAEADRLALQDRQARRLVAEKSGLAVGEKGDPGPLSTRTPKIQAALESLFTERFGSAELTTLKEGFRSANPGQLEESAAGRMMSRLTGLMHEKRSLSETEIGQLKGADFYVVLFERVRASERVKDDALQALAQRRADHAMDDLKAAGAPMARIRQGAVEKTADGSRDIVLKLDVETVRNP